MERQYPPFGQIPGLVPGDHQLQARTPHTAVNLSAFFGSADGVLATVWTATTAPELQGVDFSFEQLTATSVYGHLTIWADVDPVPNLPSAPVAANLASGGRGQDAGLDFRSYTLWFPVELDIIVTAVRFTLAWPEAGIENKVMLLHRSQLVAAADKAIDLTPPTAGS